MTFIKLNLPIFFVQHCDLTENNSNFAQSKFCVHRVDN